MVSLKVMKEFILSDRQRHDEAQRQIQDMAIQIECRKIEDRLSAKYEPELKAKDEEIKRLKDEMQKMLADNAAESKTLCEAHAADLKLKEDKINQYADWSMNCLERESKAKADLATMDQFAREMQREADLKGDALYIAESKLAKREKELAEMKLEAEKKENMIAALQNKLDVVRASASIFFTGVREGD
jgi:hypothetical protein